MDNGVIGVSLGRSGDAVFTNVLTATLPAGTQPTPGRVGFTGATFSGTEVVTIDNFHLTGDSPTVRIIYLVPSDRAVQPQYQDATRSAILDLQQWFGVQMNDGRTFQLHSPVVETLRTPHPAAWYATHNAAANAEQTFWSNVLEDAFNVTGGEFNDPNNRWIYYIDAGPARGQIGGAGTSGVAVIPANDLRGLTGQPIIQINGDESTTFGRECWIGGLGHELGHAFNLPHPAACEDEDPTTNCPDGALMWTGYATFPNAFLLPTDKVTLGMSVFFSLTM